MSDNNVERYRALAEAFSRRDLDAFLAHFDPEVEFEPRSAALEGGALHGHDGLRTWWDTMFGLFSEYRVEIDEAVDLGNVTFARVRVRGEGMGSGAPLEDTQWHVVEWSSGLVVRWQSLHSEAEARQAAGLPATA